MIRKRPSERGRRETIPVIDLGPYLAGEPGAMERTASELRFALTEIGFYFIVNHGVPAALIRDDLPPGRALPRPAARREDGDQDRQAQCRLPADARRHAAHLDGADRHQGQPQRGAVHGARPAADHPDVLADRRFRSANRWPADLPGFRETVVDYCDAMERLVQKLVRLYALALDLPAAYFDGPFREFQYKLRMTHYPNQAGAADDEFGIAPHTDTEFPDPARAQRRARPLDPHAKRQVDRRPGRARRLCREWRADAAALDQRCLPGHAAPRGEPERRRALCAGLLLRQPTSTGRSPRCRPPSAPTGRRNIRRPSTPTT